MSDLQNRLSIRFVGESGQGINTLGELASKALKNSNFYTFAYREYPSLIKGGIASYQIDISSESLNSSSRYCDILISLDKDACEYYIKTAYPQSIVIYDDKSLEGAENVKDIVSKSNLQCKYIATEETAEKAGGTKIMANMVLLGVLWKALNLDTTPLEEIVRETFKNKNIDLEAEVKCIEAGYNIETDFKQTKNIKQSDINLSENKIISGNESLALGLLSGGLRAYYAYPMTPATSILKFLGNTYKETSVLIKQAESEITAAQLVLGSMHAGTRAATATSGGGFDLMTESISCAGITETPFVVVLAQRAGAGTGVPTWTGAGDLTAAVNSGHGEFPRCVIAVSDINSAYILAQEALNIAEEYQIPVILLTEKQIAESLYNIKNLPEPLEIKRGKITQDTNTPYKITEDGISPRPVLSKTDVFLRNSDEHTEEGISTEDSLEVKSMSDKRALKMKTLEKNIPEPMLYGKKDSNIVFVGWGSVKSPVLDAINTYDLDTSYLHYEYIYPAKIDFLKKLIGDGKRIILIENNEFGELGRLLSEKTGYEFTEKLLKFDGRPFFVEDILEYLEK
jgi:2-oxoglutarate ferredoxin oxidoreductase subunit alpha